MKKEKFFGFVSVPMVMIIGIIVFGITGCACTYHVEVFSHDIQTLPTNTVYTRDQNGMTTTKKVIQGEFEASTYEAAMEKAEASGYTKVLSIESGVKSYLLFNVNWVRIRCTKEALKATSDALNDKG
jgi:hypothetical protein